MVLITKYFFMTLIIIQGFFLFFWYTNLNFLGILSWTGKEDINFIRLFSPLILYGAIKILYWFADPLSKLYTLILNWVTIIGIIYAIYWLFLT